MIIPKAVLLCKSQISEDDKYQELLKANGFEVSQIKTLVFEFKNLNVLEKILKDSENYNGIILSSPRCVRAVELATKNNPNVLENWVSKSNFVVGEATHKEALERLGLISCLGKESGNAVNLSKIIIANKEFYSPGKPFLFPHGNLKTDTLNLELATEEITIQGILVYDTLPNPNIEQELETVTKHFTSLPEYVVLFSPSGLRSSIEFLRRIPEDLAKVKFIAIGPVTEQAMQDDNIKVYAVAKSPSPESVLGVILN